jgi:hypothetical protein
MLMIVPTGPPPPPCEQPNIGLLTVRPGSPVAFWLLSNTIFGYQVHFHEGHTIPCVLSLGHCICETEGLSTRWAGYVAVQSLFSHNAWILRITPGAMQHCKELKELDGRLRGRQIHLKRMGPAFTAPLGMAIVTPGAETKVPDKLREIDVPAQLERLWGLSPIKPRS